MELLNIDVSRDFFDLFYQNLFIITTGPTSLRFSYNLIAFNHFDGYLVHKVGIFSALGLLFVRHFDAVLFADIPEDVRGGLVVSIDVLGLF